MRPLVNIRCPACRKVLATIDKVPTDWTATIDVPPCQKHTPDAFGPINPRRWRRMRTNAARSGTYDMVVAHRVHLSDLRPAVDRALKKGTTVDETIAGQR